MKPLLPPEADIRQQIAIALAEDVGEQDWTAMLIDEHTIARANIVTREDMVVCGQAWVIEALRQVDPRLDVTWQVAEGDQVAAGAVLCVCTGPARGLLTAERTALNFLQTLSGTASTVRQYVDAVGDLPVKVMDTRKTLPGLRLAQKYAVQVGGGVNQRVGLFDGILIKENHIAAAGSIAAAVAAARRLLAEKGGQVPIQLEVESLMQLGEALDADVSLILLDNFSLDDMCRAVAQTAGRAELEASGNTSLQNIRTIAQTGVQRISIGALTKHLHAIDLSMRFD